MNGQRGREVRRAHQVARPRRARSRRALTLVDLVIGLVVASVIVAGIGGVLILTSHAVPQSASAATPTTVSSGRVADEIVSELRYATAFREMAPFAVAFEVPDRDSDGNAELIRYAWGGLAGDPVTRAYNGGTPVEVAPGAENLVFVFSKRKVTTTGPPPPPESSPPTLLASFTGWTGVSATSSNLTVGTTSWNSQAFRIDPALMPANATNIAITHVRLKMKKPLLGGSDALVWIHRRQSAGSHLPATAGVGSTGTIGLALLTTSFAWVAANFNDVVFPSLEPDLCIVVKGLTATSAQVQYLNASTAPADANFYRWSNDSGATWLPTSGWDRNDAYYEVWGTYQTAPTPPPSIDTWYLTTVGVTLDVSPGAAGAVRATARVLNEPEVPGP